MVRTKESLFCIHNDFYVNWISTQFANKREVSVRYTVKMKIYNPGSAVAEK